MLLSGQREKRTMQKDSGPLLPLHWTGLGSAVLVASGGIVGYAKASSVLSLAAGLPPCGLASLVLISYLRIRGTFGFS